MIVNLSEAASNVMLDAIAGLLDGGSIELLSDTQGVLAVLKLSDPAAMTAVGGSLEFNKIGEGDAALTGRAEFARVLAADGSEVFSCDVGGENSDAVIKLTGGALINRGAPVRLSSFRLSMP
jgi:hypothetical protein